MNVEDIEDTITVQYFVFKLLFVNTNKKLDFFIHYTYVLNVFIKFPIHEIGIYNIHNIKKISFG